MATTTASVTLESFSSRAAGSISGTTFTLDKPTGLEVGDLMVAGALVADSSAGKGTWTKPADWTELETANASGDHRMAVFYKVADADDVAATNFTFGVNYSGSTNYSVVAGSILRLSSYNGLDKSSSAVSTTITGFTPQYVDSYFVFFATASGLSSGDVSGSYALTNDNPTWTEQFNTSVNDSGSDNWDGGFAFATAERAEKTATGDATFSAGGDDIGGILLNVNPIINGSITDSGQDVEIRTFPIISMGDIEVTQTAPTVSGRDTTAWTNQSRSSTTWTNQTKNG